MTKHLCWLWHDRSLPSTCCWLFVASFVRWVGPLRSVVAVCSSSSVVVARSVSTFYFPHLLRVAHSAHAPLLSTSSFSVFHLAERPVDSLPRRLRLFLFLFCFCSVSGADFLYLRYVARTLLVPDLHIVDRHPEGITPHQRLCFARSVPVSLTYSCFRSDLAHVVSPPTLPPV